MRAYLLTSLIIITLITLSTLVYLPLYSNLTNYLKFNNNNNALSSPIINIPAYILGPEDLQNVAEKAGFSEIHMLTNLTIIPDKMGVLIIGRKLDFNETLVLKNIFKKRFVIVTVSNDTSNQVLNVISNFVALIAKFNNTEIYAFKILSNNQLLNGKYPVLIKGYAGKISEDVLKDSAKIAFESSNDWITIGYIEWTSGDSWKPYGKLNVIHKINREINEIMPNEDIYVVQATTEIISGYKLGWTQYGLAWWNDHIKNMYYLNYYTSIYNLLDYQPSSMNNIPPTIVISFYPALSWTYPGNYIAYISAEGDLGLNKAGWYHELTSWQWGYGTIETIRIEPGFEFSISPLITGTQRWEITGSWIAPSPPHGVPTYPFSGTIIIDVTLQY